MSKLTEIKEAVGGTWQAEHGNGGYSRGWSAFDRKTKIGKVRIARTGAEGEPLDVYVFKDECILKYSANFSHEVPNQAIIAFVKAILKKG